MFNLMPPVQTQSSNFHHSSSSALKQQRAALAALSLADRWQQAPEWGHGTDTSNKVTKGADKER